MLKKLFGLVFQELPSIEEAAGITRDRALQGRQDAIDILKRTLGEMENNPVAQQLQDVLSQILDSPSLITDEIFNNIMSKTGEVLDATYDAEVGQLLDAARARGIAGPALQTQIQRAKEAKSTALANAYREAIIARAREGKQTQLQAIQAGNSLLSNLFNQKRVLTQSLANVLQSVVEEPFVNPGPPSLPKAPREGGAGGGGSIDFKGFIGPRLGEMTPEEAKARKKRVASMPGQVTEGGGKTVTGTLTDKERFGLTNQIKELQNQVNKPQTPEEFARQQAILRESGVAPFPEQGTGTVEFTKVAEKALKDSLPVATRETLLTKPGSEAAEGLAGDVSKFNQIKGFGEPVGVTGFQQPAPDFSGGQETTLRGFAGQTQPLVFGGDKKEARRVSEELVPQFGIGNVIGTSSGAGVRQSAQPAAKPFNPMLNWKWIAGPNGTVKKVPMSSAEIAATGGDFRKLTGESAPTRRGTELLKQFVGEHQAARRARKAGKKPKTGKDTVIRTSSGFGVRQ